MNRFLIEALCFFILSGLAIRGLAHLLIYEPGPFNLLSKWRDWIGATIEGQPKGWDEMNELQKVFACPFCLSFWLSLVAGAFVIPLGFPVWMAGFGLFGAYAISTHGID